jgi:carboxyl-terminal processing protease
MRNYFLFLLFLPVISFAQASTNFCDKLGRVVTLINQEHFKPKPIDDSLSVYVFDTFIDKIDPDKTLFIAAEFNDILKNKYTLDNAILNKDCTFINDFFLLYKKALVRKKHIIQSFEKEKLTLNTKDTMFFTKAKLNPIKDEVKLRKFIKKRITFDILETISNKSRNKDSLLTHFNSVAKEVEKLTYEKYICEIDLLLTEDEWMLKSLENNFLNVLCSYFDPHTAYFSFEEKSGFMSRLTINNETFGIILANSENGELYVAELIPGSLAYLSDKVEIGDQLVKLKIGKDEFPVQCNYFSKIEELFNDSSKMSAAFSFRKKNGELYTLDLEKKQQKTIENEIFSSLVIKNGKKFGYIAIPSFYADEFDENTLTKDVAKAIIHLNDESIEGLIINLQNNGGGSINEAINLVGMFIDIGPVSVLVDNKGKKNILKDFNRGMVSNKTIVVIVNGFSASASEFFANAILDYKRGIVIGGKTYGKGTSQQIFPINNNNEVDGFIKITKDKFYRINGKSHQKDGVLPDVYLPSLMENLYPKESNEMNALAGDFLDYPLRYQAMNNNFAKEIQNSSSRVAKMDYFTTITSINNQIDRFVNGDKKPVLVNFDGVFADAHFMDSINDEIAKLAKVTFDFDVKNTKALDTKIKHDEYLQKFNDIKRKQLRSNAYVFEAIHLLLELSN